MAGFKPADMGPIMKNTAGRFVQINVKKYLDRLRNKVEGRPSFDHQVVLPLSKFSLPFIDLPIGKGFRLPQHIELLQSQAALPGHCPTHFAD